LRVCRLVRDIVTFCAVAISILRLNMISAFSAKAHQLLRLHPKLRAARSRSSTPYDRYVTPNMKSYSDV